MRNAAWTPERIALLRRLWAEGKTAAAIAACLGGTSRSAVLGKIFRLRLPAPADASPAAAASAAVQDAKLARRRAVAPRADSRKRRQAAASVRGKSLLELTNETCRWPFGEPGTPKFHFCGAQGADLERGMPYCAQHARRAYFTAHVEAPDHRPASGGAPKPRQPLARVNPTRDRPFVFNWGQWRSRF